MPRATLEHASSRGGEAPPEVSREEERAVLEGHGPDEKSDPRKRLRDRLDAYMVKKKLRSTAQRRLIVDTFFAGSSHLTIEDVLREVREHDRGIGYATVYRTLKLLAESGVASERRFGDGLSRYELADEDDDHHDHLICTSCGSITEFEEPKIERLQDAVAARYKFRVTSHKHEMYGVCQKCQALEKRGAS